MKIGLLGIGRLGYQLAKHFLICENKILAYHKNIQKASDFSKELDCYGEIKPANNIDEFKNVDVIIMALPAEATLDVAKKLNKVLNEKQWIINTATEVYLSDLFSELPEGKVIAAKIIGNAYEIEKGERPSIVIDGTDKCLVEKTVKLFSHLGHTIKDNERLVSKINKIGAIEAIRTVLRIEKRLGENNLDLDDKVYSALLSNVVAGTIKTYSTGNIGPFLEKVITQLKKETLK